MGLPISIYYAKVADKKNFMQLKGDDCKWSVVVAQLCIGFPHLQVLKDHGLFHLHSR